MSYLCSRLSDVLGHGFDKTLVESVAYEICITLCGKLFMVKPFKNVTDKIYKGILTNWSMLLRRKHENRGPRHLDAWIAENTQSEAGPCLLMFQCLPSGTEHMFVLYYMNSERYTWISAPNDGKL